MGKLHMRTFLNQIDSKKIMMRVATVVAFFALWSFIFMPSSAYAASYTWDFSDALDYDVSESDLLEVTGGTVGLLPQWINRDITGDTGSSWCFGAGDVTGDGYLDIYVANKVGQQNRLWINDGTGNFTANDIAGDLGNSDGVGMGDVDGDGDIDMYVSNDNGQQNHLWINDGTGNFTANDIVGDTGNSRGCVTIADLDGDTHLDIYTTQYSGQQNRLWINDGVGNFTAQNIAGDLGNSNASHSADFNGDGFLDLYVTNRLGGNYLWLNDGAANFTAAHIAGDSGYSYGAGLGDVDDDGDIDIYVANQNNTQNFLWLNDGVANFTAAHIAGDTFDSARAVITDLNWDGIPDIYSQNYNGQKNSVWINDGTGNFTSDPTSVLAADFGTSFTIRSVDLDNDTDNDLYIATVGAQNKIWINGYSLDQPYVSPVDSVPFTQRIDSFSLSLASGTTGEVSLQVSSDDGATWHYWNGGAWAATVAVDGTETSSVGEVEDNIRTFDTDGGDFLWRAFLVSDDGNDFVGINDIAITYDTPSTPRTAIRYICKDPLANNYNDSKFGRHRDSECEYAAPGSTTTPAETDMQEVLTNAVAGASCPYFHSYQQYGAANDEVKIIQAFLKELGFYTGVLDSVYGPLTDRAIRAFQAQYAEEVLAPWGLDHPTGRWYQTTRNQANKLSGCDEGTIRLDNGTVIN